MFQVYRGNKYYSHKSIYSVKMEHIVIHCTCTHTHTHTYTHIELTSLPPRHSAVSLEVNCSRKFGSSRLIMTPFLSLPTTTFDFLMISLTLMANPAMSSGMDLCECVCVCVCVSECVCVCVCVCACASECPSLLN